MTLFSTKIIEATLQAMYTRRNAEAKAKRIFDAAIAVPIRIRLVSIQAAHRDYMAAWIDPKPDSYKTYSNAIKSAQKACDDATAEPRKIYIDACGEAKRIHKAAMSTIKATNSTS